MKIKKLMTYGNEIIRNEASTLCNQTHTVSMPSMS